jgi:hypothetical protein
MSSERSDLVAGLLALLDAFIAAYPTLLVRRFKVRPPSLVTDTPCAYIDLRPATVSYDSARRITEFTPSIVFVDRLTDNGETMDRFDTLIGTFNDHLALWPHVVAGTAWSDGTWADEQETLGDPEGRTVPAAAARWTFGPITFDVPRI